MELGICSGQVVWIKDNGDISDREVSVKAAVVFCGFPEPSGSQGGECVSMEVVEGDPVTDDIIMVWAKGHAWKRKFLLSKTTGEYEVLRKGDEAIARQVIASPPAPGTSLEECIEEKRKDGRKTIDLEAMAEEGGLKVWGSNFFRGFWNPEYGEFDDLPDGWSLLPKGDATLTRRVRKGPYWVLLKKDKRYSVELGTLAPAENIEEAFVELGGEEAALSRRDVKEKGREKKEERMTEMLRIAVMRCFPKMPAGDLEEVLRISRSGSAVGAAQWLYFPPSEEAEEAYNLAATLAVRTYVRHHYTDYDEKLSGSLGDEEARKEARRSVSRAIEEILEKWRAA